jgi:ribosome maturation factor RimP
MPPAPASSPAAKIRARLLELLTPVVNAANYDLEDISVTAAGRRNLIRIIVDADGGVDLDAVAALSRAMSEALDSDATAGPDFAEPYVLEVSSPGVDRPLTENRHWRRALGRLVEVTVDGQPLVGRIVSTDGSGVTFEVAGVKGRPSKTRVVAWGALGRGKVQVEFNRKSASGEDALDFDELDDDDESVVDEEED